MNRLHVWHPQQFTTHVLCLDGNPEVLTRRSPQEALFPAALEVWCPLQNRPWSKSVCPPQPESFIIGDH